MYGCDFQSVNINIGCEVGGGGFAVGYWLGGNLIWGIGCEVVGGGGGGWNLMWDNGCEVGWRGFAVGYWF